MTINGKGIRKRKVRSKAYRGQEQRVVPIPVIGLEEGWSTLEKGITKLKNLLEGGPTFNIEEFSALSLMAYNMCYEEGPNDHSQELYKRYKETFEDHIRTLVLPALRGKRDDGDHELMLREFVKRWNDQKIMARWLSRIFNRLEGYNIRKSKLEGPLPFLEEVGLLCFRDGVFAEVKNDVRDAVVALINRGRDGEKIDEALVKSGVGVFVEMGGGKLDAYEGYFEVGMLADMADYHSRKAASLIEEDCYAYYMLDRWNKRALWYMPAISSGRLLFEPVQHELLSTKIKLRSWRRRSPVPMPRWRDDVVRDFHCTRR